LQRSAGNRAVTSLLDVQRLTAEERSENLTSARYAGEVRLEAAFDNSPPMKLGERGEAVARVQLGLVDDEFALPKSTKPDGTLDGVFGGETISAVRGFQRKHELTGPGGVPDGVIGRRTLTALDGLSGGSAPTPPGPKPGQPCVPGAVSNQTDPLPEIAPPSLSFMSPTQIAATVGKTGAAPLAAHRPGKFSFPGVNVSVIDTGGPCKKCVATWEPPVPTVEIFVGTGTFSDEKRFFVGRPGDVSGCDTGPIPDLLDVRKVIDPGLVPRLLAGELEHWLDFRRTWQLTVGRLLANVRRLTPERTHLTGSGPDECNRNVGAFLAVASGDPGLAIVADQVAPGYGALPPIVIPPVDAQSALVRDSGPHRAESTPPKSQGPVRPNIDTAKNPFGCAAFFVGFGPGALPGVPGAPSTEVVKDLGDPPKQPWHLL
jgi:peptidoglycan hydrolase-like protein with peptidoglycan-binding domain